MNEYWIDFSGYLKVKATSPDDADRKMWNLINSMSMIDNFFDDFSDDEWEIESIEKVEEG